MESMVGRARRAKPDDGGISPKRRRRHEQKKTTVRLEELYHKVSCNFSEMLGIQCTYYLIEA